MQISMDFNNLKFKTLSLNVLLKNVSPFSTGYTSKIQTSAFCRKLTALKRLKINGKSSGPGTFTLLMALTIVVGSPSLYVNPLTSN